MQPLFIIDKNHVSFSYKLPKYEPGFNATEQMSMLGADNDYDAVIEFLSQYYDSPNTLISYAKEAERFLLWLIHMADKPLSAVNRQDWQNFIKFIENPPADWSGPKVPRHIDNKPNPAWRPFNTRFEAEPLAKSQGVNKGELVTGLGKSSSKLSQKIVETMFGFFVDNGYLNANPCSTSRSRRRKNHEQPVTERSLEIELVDEVIDYLYQQQKAATNVRKAFQFLRSRYIIQLLTGTGLRVSESTGHTFGDIKVSKEEWVLNIVGKGEKPRSIVIFADLKAVISEFRLAIGLNSPTPLFGEKTALIPSQYDLNKPITTRRVDQIFREVFDQYARLKCELAQQVDDPEEKGYLFNQVSILEKVSPHWCRHTHATNYLQDSGHDLKSTMDRLGHAHVNVTFGYIHSKQKIKED